MMTKKNYIQIAKIIKSEKEVKYFRDPEKTMIYQEAIQSIASKIFRLLQSDNPSFDDEKFLKACSPDRGE